MNRCVFRISVVALVLASVGATSACNGSKPATAGHFVGSHTPQDAGTSTDASSLPDAARRDSSVALDDDAGAPAPSNLMMPGTMHATQNGDPNFGLPSTVAASGYGGVGGEGPGGPVTDTQRGVLTGTATVDANVKILYPYDQTVWPLDLLPPLLQWDASSHHFDGAYLHVQEAGFEYEGFFSAPRGTASFVNLPIPQDAWRAFTAANTGDSVQVSLTFSEGQQAYGPYTLTWKIAQASLRGTVYYNSYGTALVTNADGSYNNTNGGRFGVATLAIKPGTHIAAGGAVPTPRLVAGISTPSGETSGCRGCHSVSSNGSLLMTQHGDAYDVSSVYQLTNDDLEISMDSPRGLAFSALYPDGSQILTATDSAPMNDLSQPASLVSVPDGAAIPAIGLRNFLATMPVFSPDGKHLAYVDGESRNTTLYAVDFDNTSKTFANTRPLCTAPSGEALRKIFFPSFLPTSDGVIYSRDSGTSYMGSTATHSELWWIDLATLTPVRLDQLNGRGYLPVGPYGHDHDDVLNYEPTVNPIASGGYIWVVFTSRRLYGNVATIDPMSSNPSTFDWTTEVTPKKLWVAAFDLNAPPGTDPSHPAFYLPAQELQGGNSRGYWTPDPCREDHFVCGSGDQCCGGYCTPDNTCSSTPAGTCAQIYDRCSATSDCCNQATGVTCINNICSVVLN